MALLITLTIGLGLWIDASFPHGGQIAVNIWVWLVFAYLLFGSDRSERVGLIICLCFATLGEVFLSLVWGLYEYPRGSIPLFVLAGHCLLYTLGIIVAKRLPKQVIYLVPMLTLPYIIFAGVTGFDNESILWFIVFLACLRYGPAKKLYATMFVLALIMELYGTWLGNWTWAATVPWLGLTSSNPPACAGVFYCLLDLIVTSLTPGVTSLMKTAAPMETARPPNFD